MVEPVQQTTASAEIFSPVFRTTRRRPSDLSMASTVPSTYSTPGTLESDCGTVNVACTAERERIRGAIVSGS
eukprot:scaffold23482_cov63-Phaeocystis_antarctica.AAC.3